MPHEGGDPHAVDDGVAKARGRVRLGADGIDAGISIPSVGHDALVNILSDFEGTIPKGEYGGGTVMLWYPQMAAASLRKGELKFTLAGEKLQAIG